MLKELSKHRYELNQLTQNIYIDPIEENQTFEAHCTGIDNKTNYNRAVVLKNAPLMLEIILQAHQWATFEGDIAEPKTEEEYKNHLAVMAEVFTDVLTQIKGELVNETSI